MNINCFALWIVNRGETIIGGNPWLRAANIII